MKVLLRCSMLFCVAILFVSRARGQYGLVNGVDSNIYRNLFRNIRDNVFDLTGRTTSSSRALKQLKDRQKLQVQIPEDVSFPCSTDGYRSSKRPTSVHQLRPGDIDVIGAMGDSLTAGHGAAATNLLQIASENRGVSWSIGGQGTWRQFLTLPNIIKEFNPNLIGYSMGDHLSHHKMSQFNVAEGGAMSVDMPYMAKELVRRMRMDPRVDIERDWKLITIMIGGNDFCSDMCYRRNPADVVENHRRDLDASLKILRDNLPRTLVNIVPCPSIETIVNITGKPDECRISHLLECPCFFGPQFGNKIERFIPIMKKWQRVEAEVINSPAFNNLDTFAAVQQPFTTEVTWPTNKKANTDLTILSADCFHFSQKGYTRASNALWNNMLEPVGRKSTNWKDPFTFFRCPTAKSPYIFTNKNSRSPYFKVQKKN